MKIVEVNPVKLPNGWMYSIGGSIDEMLAYYKRRTNGKTPKKVYKIKGREEYFAPIPKETQNDQERK